MKIQEGCFAYPDIDDEDLIKTGSVFIGYTKTEIEKIMTNEIEEYFLEDMPDLKFIMFSVQVYIK